MILQKQFIKNLTEHINSVCGENFTNDDIEVIFGSSLFYIIAKCLECNDAVETEIGVFSISENNLGVPEIVFNASGDIANVISRSHNRSSE